MTIKKILICIYLISLCIAPAAFAFAVPPIPTIQNISRSPLPQVSIENVKTDFTSYKGGNEVKGTFLMTNRSTQLVDGLYYGISIAKEYDKKTNIAKILLDTQKVRDPIILKPRESKEINFSYVIPKYIDGTDLGIHIDAYYNNDMALGWGDYNPISITKVIGGVTFDQFWLATSDGKKYPTGSGPMVGKDRVEKQISLHISFKNTTTEKIQVTPKFKIFNQFKQDVILKEFDGEHITVGPKSISEISSTELPVFDYTPGVYFGRVEFLDGNGEKRAQGLNIRYIVDGDIATIQTFTSDQKSVNNGEILKIKLTYSGKPIDIAKVYRDKVIQPKEESLDVAVKIYNESDELVASFATSTPVSGGGTIEMGLTSENDASALRGVATLSKNEKVLFEKKEIFSEEYNEKHSNPSRKLVKFSFKKYGAISFLVILLISLMILFRIRKFTKVRMVVSILILLILLILFFIPIFKTPKAIGGGYTYYSINDGTSGSMYINTPVDGTYIQAGSGYVISGRAYYHGCYNYDGGLDGYAATWVPYWQNPSAQIFRDNQRWYTCGHNGGQCQSSVEYDRDTIFGFTLIADTTPGYNKSAYLQAVMWSGVWGYNIQQIAYYNVPLNGICGPTNNTVQSTQPSGVSACSSGTVSNPTVSTSTLNWSCLGNYNGSNSSCAAYLSASCGYSNGISTGTMPTINLCQVGTNSTVTANTNSFDWTCNNGPSVATCSAVRVATCGTADGVPKSVKPTSNLCSGGTASAVTGSINDHTYEWTCTGIGGVSSCSAPALSACGTKNGQAVYSLPPNNLLCSTESSPSSPLTTDYANGIWTWACQNVNKPTPTFCTNTCVAGNYICKADAQCETTCSDWCPDSVSGNPTGKQSVRSLLNIDTTGKCSVSQIDKYYLRPAIADKDNKCYAFWSIKSLGASTAVNCNIDGTSVSCDNLLTGKAVTSGDHTLNAVVSYDQNNDGKFNSQVVSGVSDFNITDSRKIKCVANPSHSEI